MRGIVVRCGSLVLTAMVCSSLYAQTGMSRASASAPQYSAAPAPPAQAPQAPAATQLGAGIPASGVPRQSTPAGYVAGQPMPMPLPAPAADLKTEAIDRIAPLNAKEILELRKELGVRASAMQQPLEPTAKPVRRVVRMDLSPGAAPEVIRTAVAQGSVITFLDAAGRPWPVVSADNFNPAGFDIATFGLNGVSVGVKAAGARAGNMAVLLDGLQIPVTLSIQTGQREVDYSVEFHIPRILPGQPAPVGAVEQVLSLGAADLMNYLLNTPPEQARALVADSPLATAWQVSPDRMIVRTTGLVASPTWRRRQSSALGVSVYDLPLTPVVLVAAEGQLLPVRLSGFGATREAAR